MSKTEFLATLITSAIWWRDYSRPRQSEPNLNARIETARRFMRERALQWKTMKIDLSEVYCSDPERACRLALRRTAHIHWKERMPEIDKLLGLSGVESIHGEWQNGYWCNVVASYCNTGDTYATTVVHVRGDTWDESGCFLVCSWGSWLEQNETKFRVE